MGRWIESLASTIRVYGIYSPLVILSYVAYKMGRPWRPRVRVSGVTIREQWRVLRFIRELYVRGHRLVDGKGGSYTVEFYGYKLFVPRGEDLGVFIEDIESFYGGDYGGKRVLDVGGFIGETAIYFLYRGASSVIVYEPHPLLYKALVYNVESNGFTDRVDARNRAVCLDEGKVSLWGESVTLGLSGPSEAEGLSEAMCDPIERVVSSSSVDVAKFNCEGCEYYLITLDCNVLASIGRYIVQVHGSPQPIISRFMRCGFSVRHRGDVGSLISVYEFTRGVPQAKIVKGDPG